MSAMFRVPVKEYRKAIESRIRDVPMEPVMRNLKLPTTDSRSEALKATRE